MADKILKYAGVIKGKKVIDFPYLFLYNRGVSQKENCHEEW